MVFSVLPFVPPHKDSVPYGVVNEVLELVMAVSVKVAALSPPPLRGRRRRRTAGSPSVGVKAFTKVAARRLPCQPTRLNG